MSYAAVTLGIFFFIFAYFNLNAPPADTNQKNTASAGGPTGFCEVVDEATAPTFQAPADWATKVDSEAPAGSREINAEDLNESCGDNFPRHILSPTNTTYQLIRKSVPLSNKDVKGSGLNFEGGESCHFDTAESLNIQIPEVDATKFKVFFPEVSGEISIDGELPSRTRGRNSDLLYFIDYGLVFLLHVNAEGKFTEYQGGTTQGDSETFYLADVYRDIGSGRPELPPDTFKCDSTQGAKTFGKQVIVPDQNVSTTPDQMQLEYFVIDGGGSVVNGWGIHCKPAVYLYPPKPELVNVKVYPSGFLTYTDPPYNSDTGWTVQANPNGTIFNLDRSPILSNYLYFESKIRDEVIQKPTQGWVVKFDELDNLYQNILPKLGLNTKQVSDFRDYWNKTLPNSPYYFVGIINQDNVNEIEKLEITPKPDSINRVRVYFERLDSPKQVLAPVLKTNNNERITMNEFRVVEWGGMVKNDPNHPFTCSQ